MRGTWSSWLTVFLAVLAVLLGGILFVEVRPLAAGSTDKDQLSEVMGKLDQVLENQESMSVKLDEISTYLRSNTMGKWKI